jgi:hypothetical protein
MLRRRHVVLPARGTLLVSTDIHGNGEDFRRLRAIFDETRARDPDTHWLILGDIVHAPNERARREAPALYDYDDESGAIVRGVHELVRAHPSHVFFVLGNHDYGHIGGFRTNKFYDDEVSHLESILDDETRGMLRAVCTESLIAAVAPCGAFFAHGSPDATLRALSDLDRIALPRDPKDPDIAYHSDVLRTFLTSYGQPRAVTERLLATVSAAGTEVRMVIHGHDRSEDGWFVEGGNQLCPCIFGAPREKKRYVRLDLAARYASVDALRDGHEISKLY